MKEYKIDATNKSLGRVASEAAIILRGKNSPDFAPNRVPDVKLIIENSDKIKITGKKMEQKKYYRHSGYPGNLKVFTLRQMIEKKGIPFVLKKAISGMLPKNKLRKEMLKRLEIR